MVKESEEVKTALGTDVEENKTTLTYDKTSVGIGASDSVSTMTKYNYTLWS